MKKVLTIAALLSFAVAPALADAMSDMHACMAIEQDRSDASRSGVSAREFCAAQAAIENDRPSPVDTAISWLTRKNAEDPAGAQAAMDSCRRGAGQTYAELLTCMAGILGP